jgi:hypothetical protein
MSEVLSSSPASNHVNSSNKGETMDNVLGGSAQAQPQAARTLVRSALVMTDLVALPLLCIGFATAMGFALASVGIAAGGINFLFGLRFLDFFPVFPAAARVLSALSLLAFAALLLVLALLLWKLSRAGWQRFWSWHGSAWAGVFFARASAGRAISHGRRVRGFAGLISLFGIVFLGLLAAAFGLMMALARGPFWHVWRWFV